MSTRFNPVSVIQKKRDGEELDSNEINQFIEGITQNQITDYQATALLMATFFNGMTFAEIAALTEAMMKSGKTLDLSKVNGPKIDKHSTGGIGDKVSIVLAPLAAACGVKVPMMSGRGLGFSGGTLDKLESIPGFQVSLEEDQVVSYLNDFGCAMFGQTSEIAPADRKLYALRDVTATVECMPLIVSSILSKKAAEGSDGLVFDVKVGTGAFMKRKPEARKLASTLIKVSKKLGISCRALLTTMDQPLGYAVGNSIEIQESVEILKNEHHPDLFSCDLKELTIQLTAQMLTLAKVCKNLAEARKLAHQKLADGSAYEVFLKMVEAQGGDPKIFENSSCPQKLGAIEAVIEAPRTGYANYIDAESIGHLLVEMGGGRKKSSDKVDPAVGLAFYKKQGARVRKGEPLARIYARSQEQITLANEYFRWIIGVGTSRKASAKLILESFIK